MIKSELIERVAAENPHLYATEAEAVVNTILNRIAEALEHGDRVELRDFGTFSRRQRAARTGRNPRTGEAVAVAAKDDVHFKAGKAMRARLNPAASEADLERESRCLLKVS